MTRRPPGIDRESENQLCVSRKPASVHACLQDNSIPKRNAGMIGSYYFWALAFKGMLVAGDVAVDALQDEVIVYLLVAVRHS
jgi:hypothetical protein